MLTLYVVALTIMPDCAFAANAKGVQVLSKKIVPSKKSSALCFWLVLLTVAGAALAIAGCDRNTGKIGAYSPTEKRDCLPPLKLIDQNGRKLSLSSLKGKPVLFDFIYTSCPGPCLVLTTRMKAIADQLGAALGSQVSFVSLTVDPEHDGPAALKTYAKEQGVDRAGWYFLTGPPADIDRLMALFKLRRQRESDGSIEHVLEFFLVGADGQPLVQYLASNVNPAQVAADLQDAIAGKHFASAS